MKKELAWAIKKMHNKEEKSKRIEELIGNHKNCQRKLREKLKKIIETKQE